MQGKNHTPPDASPPCKAACYPHNRQPTGEADVRRKVFIMGKNKNNNNSKNNSGSQNKNSDNRVSDKNSNNSYQDSNSDNNSSN